MEQASDDDHYIPDARNAHIDTSEFERQLVERGQRMLSDGASIDQIVDEFYIYAFQHVAEKPASPVAGDNQLICRYLSPEKFLLFVVHKELYFPIASQFDDVNECSIPGDYNNAVLKVLRTLELDATDWMRHVRLNEPPRVFRRPVGVSQAAIA